MSLQLALFGPPRCLSSPRSTTPPSSAAPGGKKFRAQPHPRLDHPEITTDHLAWIGPGGQVCTERRRAGESIEAWAEREALRTWSAVFASPAYRVEQVREKALLASVAAGRIARGQGTEDELRAAEDDVIRAIAARRRAS